MQQSTTPELSVVVPVYGSSATLKRLTQRLFATLEELQIDFEVVFVEDGSPDDSWRVLTEIQRAHPDHVTIVQLMRNFGQHNALMCGFRHATGRFIVTIDDDLQNPPEEISKLWNQIHDSDLDLVYGTYDEKKHSRYRNLGSATVNLLYRLVFRNDATVTSFRIIRRELVEAVLRYDLNFTYVDGLLAWNTEKIANTSVAHEPRRDGRTGYSLGKLLNLALNLFTNFSLIPLQVVALLGFIVAVLGLSAGFYYLVRYFVGEIAVPGYASTIIAILIMGGIELLAFGMIGEYIGRMHQNVNRKPQYTVRSVLSHRPTDEAWDSSLPRAGVAMADAPRDQ